MTKYLNVGKIVNTHGIKGEVRVQSITNRPEERYMSGNELVVETTPDSYQTLKIASHRQHKSFDLLTFEGYTNINEVESLVNKTLLVDESTLPELSDNEYYISQIIGFDVKDEDENLIGRLKEVLSYPANDVWVVERSNKKDLLLPNITSVILNVNIEKEEITVHILEGLDADED